MQVRKYQKHLAGADNLEKVLSDVHKALRKNISFGGPTQNGLQSDNVDCAYATVTTPNPNTEFSVTHNLNRIPMGFIVIRVNESANFWDSGTPWTDTKIFLECDNNAAIATIMIF